ncbi:conserved Plasmodium protein, unknown function [Plasmodium berghei]|uniref:EGF-like domain-containing protein n=2 Tax=Plasmodium berghei TaxID=5821 RepID=A0A509ARP4_PLABA|nr:conserved Plasmodium protein, unknown function [Plasmodium berghei ANKA]SCL95464.1 conserved Plasmodium protein, unknown function [Plasmodium berghei]SCM16263.1 conserved Plasmodium protein, unknown function [Plasmodium berghei]SCM18059.1 conserved Plasmodium protein, unknown function [Plasmodium berghei]SCN26511.1 conserved Plasmodium protein, unknown function [Plasmodium berghei]VUC56385.1 conserved Plasmodium protein, unknown function [Plasmodium berghei ANKA]|eukprot:XP_034422187.1 conserved Plasmodium protein, unknown function [Plasmodium berghei ANKA]
MKIVKVIIFLNVYYFFDYVHELTKNNADLFYALCKYVKLEIAHNNKNKEKSNETNEHILEKIRDGDLIEDIKQYTAFDTDINTIVYDKKNNEIKNWAIKRRILEEKDCNLDCGNNGFCVNDYGIEYCSCKYGYSVDINMFKCEENCKINNGGCDPNAECIQLDEKGEEENNVMKGVRVLCKCKNNNNKYGGYYCPENDHSYAQHDDYLIF